MHACTAETPAHTSPIKEYIPTYRLVARVLLSQFLPVGRHALAVSAPRRKKFHKEIFGTVFDLGTRRQKTHTQTTTTTITSDKKIGRTQFNTVSVQMIRVNTPQKIYKGTHTWLYAPGIASVVNANVRMFFEVL